MILFTVTHKQVDSIPTERTLIGVGNNKNIKGVNVYDDFGDSISEKNSSYCELTALYWIWKNQKENIVGLEHYRRFFCSFNPFAFTPLTSKKINKILKKYEIIIPYPTYSKSSLYEYYKEHHDSRDLDLCIEAIKKIYPDYYDTCIDILNGNFTFNYNMFICNKKLIDNYCEWLFSILFEIENEVDFSGKDEYQSRVFGFLSERLFTVWIVHNRLKKYLCDVYQIGTNLQKTILLNHFINVFKNSKIKRNK